MVLIMLFPRVQSVAYVGNGDSQAPIQRSAELAYAYGTVGTINVVRAAGANKSATHSSSVVDSCQYISI